MCIFRSHKQQNISCLMLNIKELMDLLFSAVRNHNRINNKAETFAEPICVVLLLIMKMTCQKMKGISSYIKLINLLTHCFACHRVIILTDNLKQGKSWNFIVQNSTPRKS